VDVPGQGGGRGDDADADRHRQRDAAPMSVGPGVKVFPSLLPSGEVAYVRRDSQAQGVFYDNGKTGLAGDVRWPSWSPTEAGSCTAESRHRQCLPLRHGRSGAGIQGTNC